MKTFFKYSLITLAVFFASVSGTLLWFYSTDVSAEDLPSLKNGDLVFQTIKSPQTLAIMMASHTPYTHVGIVKINNKGKAIVVEAVGPVKETAMDDWIAQGIGGRITIKRMKGLSSEQARNILEAARPYYGRPYDFEFLFNLENIYCSELVYYAFKDGANLELGKIEKLKELNVDNFAVRSLIEERWEDHPVCKKQKADTFEACKKIVLEQKLITPVSIADDKRFETIFSNYPLQ